jgi:hypothetical protein
MDAYKQAYEHLRYTPCRTLNPVYFAKDGYELQWDGITHLIVVTMYNEDHVMLDRTLRGICENIEWLIERVRLLSPVTRDRLPVHLILILIYRRSNMTCGGSSALCW